MFEFFLVLFGESAFSALDFSNCQMRQKKKRSTLLFIFIFRVGWGGRWKGFDVSSCCQYEEFMWQFRTCRYVHFFLLIIVYIWFINLIIKSLKISFLFIYTFQFSLKVLIAVEAYHFFQGFFVLFPMHSIKAKFQRRQKMGALALKETLHFCFPPIHTLDISLFVARTLIVDKWG